MKNIALIGIGPHAKRIYLHYFKKKKVNLELVVDLESQKENVRKYLDENGIKGAIRTRLEQTENALSYATNRADLNPNNDYFN